MLRWKCTLPAAIGVERLLLSSVPFTSTRQLSFAYQDPNPDTSALDGYQERIRATLRAQGHATYVPD